jgi:hypothetical protein
MAIGIFTGNTLRIVTSNASALTVQANPGSFPVTGLVIDNQTLTSSVILGSNINSIIRGTASPDTLVGGPGNDTFYGGTGGDAITGGAGADVFFFTTLADGDDTLQGFEDGGTGTIDRIGASKAGLQIAATVPTGVLAASLFATFPFSGITGTATTTVTSTFFSATTFTRSLSVSEQVQTTGVITNSTTGLITIGTTSVSSSQQLITTGASNFTLTGTGTFTATAPSVSFTASGSVTATGSGTVNVGSASFPTGTASFSGTFNTPTGTSSASSTASFPSGTSNITASFNVTSTGTFTLTGTVPARTFTGSVSFTVSGTGLVATTSSTIFTVSSPVFSTFSASQSQVVVNTATISVSASEVAANTFTQTATVIGSTVVATAGIHIFYYNSIDGQLFLDPDGFVGPKQPVLLAQFNNPIPASPGFGAEDIFLV